MWKPGQESAFTEGNREPWEGFEQRSSTVSPSKASLWLHNRL